MEMRQLRQFLNFAISSSAAYQNSGRVFLQDPRTDPRFSPA